MSLSVCGLRRLGPAACSGLLNRENGLRQVCCHSERILVSSINRPPPSMALPRAIRPERTFWEKTTAMHVYCAQRVICGGNRLARHWHDATRLDSSGFVESAIRKRDLGLEVARHRGFLQRKGAEGTILNYAAAVSGQMNLIPDGEASPFLLLWILRCQPNPTHL